MRRSDAKKYDATIHDLNGSIFVEWKPSGEEPRGSQWGPFAGFCKAFTPIELDSVNEELYFDPALKEQILHLVKKARFTRMLKD